MELTPITEQADDDIEVIEGEELLTRATVDKLLLEQKQKFAKRIALALKEQQTKLFTIAAEETRRILQERK